jgi:kumamolisin
MSASYRKGARGIALSSLAAASLLAVPSSVFAQSYGSSTAITFYLNLPDTAAAEAQAQAIQTPGNPAYHHFLTSAQFLSQYAPSTATVKSVEAAIEEQGYTVTYVFPNNLAIQATAPPETVERSLGLRLNRKTVNGRTGTVPSNAPQLPAALRGSVLAIGGLDTLHLPKSHAIKALNAPAPHAVSGALTGGRPGYYLPTDWEQYYDVKPFYQYGFAGKNTTIGIVTLANFDKTDPYSFWKQIGLSVSPTRISTVDVDGGTSVKPGGDNSGETDLDIEESGAIAPDAEIRVYVASTASNGDLIDGFEAAASENIADTVSTSWGQPEMDYFYDLTTGESDTGLLDAFHAVFLEMALQGQTVYAASGDSGSFDTVRDLCSPFGDGTADSPQCTAPYTADHPASDPLVTAAGGTTTPATFHFLSGVTIPITQERAWSWDYVVQAGYPVEDVFSTGGGGGVSSYFGVPWYQSKQGGLTDTVPGQAFSFNVGDGWTTEFVLPSGFAGRNLPDLSTDADPDTGFQYVTGGSVVSDYGGTSFVAPQFNGVTALMVQALGKRVGQISPALYQLGSYVSNDITSGNNWGYTAIAGYDNATGLGTLDAAKLVIGLDLLQYGIIP